VRCEYAHDDGAYVLGALSPAERSAYERHLGTCPACREAVAEIAVLPGLLARLDPATALTLLADDGPAETPGRVRRPQRAVSRDYDDDRVTSMLAAAARKRTRDRRARRLRYASAALAAACVALVAAFGIGILRNVQTPGGDLGTSSAQMVAMTPASEELPITAKIGLVERGWGTEIVMECVYEKNSEYTKAWRVRLVAYGPDNEEEQVGSWVAAPGKVASFEGATRFAAGELTRLELRRNDGSTLLSYDVP
jgi:predicted anti-sigma-YlaC factor YlaD